MSDSATTRATRNPVRKKSAEACERCREKRIKCNGVQPCGQCIKRDVLCEYAYAPRPAVSSTTESSLERKLDLVLSRLDRLEQQIAHNDSTSFPNRCTPARTQLPMTPQTNGVAQLNQKTGCFEYYGHTSAFLIASSLGKRFRQMEDAASETDPSPTKRHKDSHPQHPSDQAYRSRCLDLDDLISCSDYIVPANVPRRDRCLRGDVAERHLESFFRTIHCFLPVFDEDAFKARFEALRKLFGSRGLVLATPEDRGRPQFVCALHAVLALGALYEDGRDDSSIWASWYFAEAQDMLGRLLDAVNLPLVQAAMFMGAYAQHVIKPNLAYVMNGIATRLAFSIGLNVESLHSSLKIDVEDARRTWSLIYIQDVELSLDSGRPMSVRSSEINTSSSLVQSSNDEETTSEPAQVVFIHYSAAICKILQNIMQLPGDHDEQSDSLEDRERIREQLEQWRNSLPLYLSFHHISDEEHGESESESFYHWTSRQQSSLRIHYNLALIILLRHTTTKHTFHKQQVNSSTLIDLHRSKCLTAARDMIIHIHRLFALAPALRRWTYYCFYCLQATLVLLPKLARDQVTPHHHHRSQRPASSKTEDISAAKSSAKHDGKRVTHSGDDGDDDNDDDDDDETLCKQAITVFSQIKMDASQRCAKVVRQFLDKWVRAGHPSTTTSTSSSICAPPPSTYPSTHPSNTAAPQPTTTTLPNEPSTHHTNQDIHTQPLHQYNYYHHHHDAHTTGAHQRLHTMGSAQQNQPSIPRNARNTSTPRSSGVQAELELYDAFYNTGIGESGFAALYDPVGVLDVDGLCFGAWDVGDEYFV